MEEYYIRVKAKLLLQRDFKYYGGLKKKDFRSVM